MSKLLENKQLLIHAAAEIVVIAGVSIFFYRKTKSLERRLKDMETILSDYNTAMENTSQVVKRLCFSVQKQQNTINNLNAKINSLISNNKVKNEVQKEVKNEVQKEVKNEVQKEVKKDSVDSSTNNEDITNTIKSIDLENISVENTTSPISITINTDDLFDNDDNDNDIPVLESNKEEDLDSEIQEELNELQDT